ncbi:hypothetical protein ACFU96_20940 [Streptomyces sp. NPDC057620]|uniref:hypothetical protein n=1 Tax=Streptomyces sp. NPDC057620 TaxID=3346185 RepID=UPI0036767BA1
MVTLVVATFAYVITNLINQSQDDLWKLAVSIVIGGAALIVQYMIDFERRMASTEAALDTRHSDLTNLVSEKFGQVSEVHGIFDRLDRARLDTDNVKLLLQSATEVQTQSPDIVKAFAHAEFARLTSVMVNLTGQIADWPGQNNDWLLSLTRCAALTMDATTSFVGRDFWETEPALRYLQAQRDAIQQRGVAVRRLFIVQNVADADGDLAETCSEQRAVGIQARVVAVAELPRDLQRGRLNDFVIFDNELCWEIDQDVMRRNASTTLNARGPHVLQRIKRFNELWDAAGEITGA